MAAIAERAEPYRVELGRAEPFRIERDGQALASASALYGAGEVSCRAQPGELTAERRYAGPCVGAVIEGLFDYRSERGEGLAAPGAIVFGNTGEAFGCRHLALAGNRRAVIALDAEALAEAANDCGLPGPLFESTVAAPSRRTAALYAVVRRAVVGGLSEDGLFELMGAALQVGHDGKAPAALAEPARIMAVARHLDAAYEEPLTLGEMAAMAGLSRFHFVRSFRAVMGESPHQYLIAARLRAAANRLLDTREPVTQIALDVGFNDLSHFNATFRRAFGASPGAWRKAA
jgi:AraC-like DNA-binding protein